MINIKHVDILKTIAELEVNLISSGIMFLFIENRTIQWKVASKKFDMNIFEVGSIVGESAIAIRSMKERKKNFNRKSIKRKIWTKIAYSGNTTC